MLPYIEGILAGAPVWVWPLLVLLLVLGWRSSRTRRTPMLLVYALPLLGIMTLGSLRALPEPSVVWTGFGIGYVLAAMICFRLQRRWTLERSRSFVTLLGEWLTLTVIMIMFWANFASGFLQQVSPDTHASVPFLAAFSCAIGAASGSFLGRAVQVMTNPRTA